MKHEDFNTLDIDAVMLPILETCLSLSAARAVHWIYTRDEREANSAYARSLPAEATVNATPLWEQILKASPTVFEKPYSPATTEFASTAYALFPFVREGGLLGILLFEAPVTAPSKLFAKLVEVLGVAAKYVDFAYQMAELRSQTYLDELTGLHNQRYLPTVLATEIERARRDDREFSLLFLDIDFFKNVNDGRGHLVGSKLLGALADILRGQVRASDYAFRYGGDEFILLLTGSNPDDAEKVAERIRQTVEQHNFTVDGHNLNLTLSIGLAAYPRHALTAEGLIHLADQAMYYGKRKSRNVVTKAG